MFSAYITLHYITPKREVKHITAPTILEELIVGAASAAASSPPRSEAKDGLVAGGFKERLVGHIRR
jgi:hypothetical protein